MSAVQGRHTQDLMRVDGVGSSALHLGEEGGEPHLLHEVEAVVAGRTVGPQGYIDATLVQLGDWGDAAGEFQVRSRAVHDGTAVLCKEVGFGFEKMRRMRAEQAGSE